MKFLFWNIADCYTEREFVDGLEKIGEYPGAKEYLLRTDPKHWLKFFFNREIKCDSNLNNIAEAFNGVEAVMLAREKPIYSMCEDLRRYLMARLGEKRKLGNSNSYKNCVGPLIREKVIVAVADHHLWKVVFNGEDGYEVRRNLEQHTVHLDRRVCSCREWDLTRIPCKHATCCIVNRGHTVYEYVADCYKQEAYMATYEHSIHPVPRHNVWMRSDSITVSPPVTRIRGGRPKLKRMRDADELREVGQGPSRASVQHCSNCKIRGHNKRSCTFQEVESSSANPIDQQIIQEHKQRVKSAAKRSKKSKSIMKQQLASVNLGDHTQE